MIKMGAVSLLAWALAANLVGAKTPSGCDSGTASFDGLFQNLRLTGASLERFRQDIIRDGTLLNVILIYGMGPPPTPPPTTNNVFDVQQTGTAISTSQPTVPPGDHSGGPPPPTETTPEPTTLALGLMGVALICLLASRRTTIA